VLKFEEASMEFSANNPALLGLAIGLMITAVVWISGMFKARHLKKEIRTLHTTIANHAILVTKGLNDFQKQIESLLQEKEHLITQSLTLQQKPNRQQLKELAEYALAIGLLLREDPTFGRNWSLACQWAKHVLYEESKWRWPWTPRNEFPPFPLRALNHKREFLEGELKEPLKKSV
jgi:hypothetical protein